MPRRGGNMTQRMWNNHNNERYNNSHNYQEHDDRTKNLHPPVIDNFKDVRRRENFNVRRRVSFKPTGTVGGSGNRGGPAFMKGRFAEMAIRNRLEEDEDMTNFKIQSDKQTKFRRRGSPIPRGGQGPRGKKKLIAGTSGWFQVTIPYGQKYEKNLLMKFLMDIVAPRPFIPHYFKVEQTSISFYIDDIKIAEDLLNADRTISMPDGFKMIIKVRNNIPQVQIDDNLKFKMKMAMSKRYNAATKALDLTKFHSDDDLREIFCGLFRPTIMLAAIEIISENLPDLEALNLAENKIHLLDHLKCLATKLPFLKILHLDNNKITSTIALDALKECQLIELVLNGNPLKNRTDEAVYVSEVRRKFPKLQKLDGIELPALIGFDVETTNAPTPKASFLCDVGGAEIVRQFLQQYFMIFDSDNRQPLLDAYHENAMFSLTATYNSQPINRLTSYLPHNRNNLRVRDLDARIRNMRNGRLPVVSFLSELPATEHDPRSFAVDLSLFTPQLIQLTVSGTFREKSVDQLRSFQRALVIVPAGSGFCIKNELLHINQVTMAQIRTAFKPLNLPTSPEPVQQQTVVTQQPQVAAAIGANPIPDDAVKMQMIQTFAQHSNMNLEYSRKCLEETNWNYERAGFVFTELHKQNKIPPEAFVK